MLLHGHSYTANPIACAAALANLPLLDDECQRKRTAIENVHTERMRGISDRGAGCNTRVLGTVAAFDLNGDAGYLSEAARGVARRCLADGVLIRPLGNVVYLIPPYDIDPGDLHRAYDVIESAAFAERRGG
jgi:adenosylmethionine-8-amino-7-oxononanoate aminotransferase